MDDYIDWFQKAENHIANAGAASSSPTEARIQLKEQKDFNDEVVAQRGRVRDILTAGRRLSKDFSGEDAQMLQDKMDVSILVEAFQFKSCLQLFFLLRH